MRKDEGKKIIGQHVNREVKKGGAGNGWESELGPYEGKKMGNRDGAENECDV